MGQDSTRRLIGPFSQWYQYAGCGNRECERNLIPHSLSSRWRQTKTYFLSTDSPTWFEIMKVWETDKQDRACHPLASSLVRRASRDYQNFGMSFLVSYLSPRTESANSPTKPELPLLRVLWEDLKQQLWPKTFNGEEAENRTASPPPPLRRQACAWEGAGRSEAKSQSESEVIEKDCIW